MKTLLLAAALSAAAFPASATIIDFDLRGTAGFGLLPGNEPGAIVGGTGGEIGAGITFNDATLVLTVNAGWGSGNGFTDLSSAVSAQHIHGPTANNNGNTQANGSGTNFSQTAGVLFSLTRTSTSQVNGAISNNTITLTSPQVTELFNGRYYVNVHTANNGGGEIRGFLVQAVPEPGAISLLGCAALALAARRPRSAVAATPRRRKCERGACLGGDSP